MPVRMSVAIRGSQERCGRKLGVEVSVGLTVKVIRRAKFWPYLCQNMEVRTTEPRDPLFVSLF